MALGNDKNNPEQNPNIDQKAEKLSGMVEGLNNAVNPQPNPTAEAKKEESVPQKHDAPNDPAAEEQKRRQEQLRLQEEEEKKKKEREEQEKLTTAQALADAEKEKEEKKDGRQEEKKEEKKAEEKKSEEAPKGDGSTGKDTSKDAIEGKQEPFDLDDLAQRPDLWKRLSYTMDDGNMGRVFSDDKNPLLDKEKSADALNHIKRLAKDGNLYLRDSGTNAFRRIKEDPATGRHSIGAPKSRDMDAPYDPVLGTLLRLTNRYFGGRVDFFRKRAEKYNSYRTQKKELKKENKALEKEEKKRKKAEEKERKRKEKEVKKELKNKIKEEKLLAKYEAQARKDTEKQRLKAEKEQEKQRLKAEKEQKKLQEREAKLRAAEMKKEEARVAKEKFARDNADHISENELDDINRQKTEAEKKKEQWVEMQDFSSKEEEKGAEKKEEEKDVKKDGLSADNEEVVLTSGDKKVTFTKKEIQDAVAKGRGNEKEEVNNIPEVPTEDNKRGSIQRDNQKQQEKEAIDAQIRQQRDRAETASKGWKEHTVNRLGDSEAAKKLKADHGKLQTEAEKSEHALGIVAGTISKGNNPAHSKQIAENLLDFDKSLSSEFNAQLEGGAANFKNAMKTFREQKDPTKIKGILEESVKTMTKVSENETGLSERNVMIGRYISETLQFAKTNGIELNFTPKERQSMNGAMQLGTIAQNGIMARSELSKMDTIDMTNPQTRTLMSRYMTMQAVDQGTRMKDRSSNMQKILGTEGKDAVANMYGRTLQSKGMKQLADPDKAKDMVNSPKNLNNVRLSRDVMSSNISKRFEELESSSAANKLQKDLMPELQNKKPMAREV